MTSELAQTYDTFLRDQGYTPKIDGDGDVLFKREGRMYFIQIYDGDPQYFRIVFPHFWEIETQEEREQVARACVAATALSKCTKLFITRDHVSATIELLLSNPDAYKAVFERLMDALMHGVNNFVTKMREIQVQTN